MPPKPKPAAPSKKTAEKKKEKVIEVSTKINLILQFALLSWKCVLFLNIFVQNQGFLCLSLDRLICCEMILMLTIAGFSFHHCLGFRIVFFYYVFSLQSGNGALLKRQGVFMTRRKKR